jgi:hypothetical protein
MVQDFPFEAHETSQLTFMEGNFKYETPQPIVGALIYSLTHIFHNLPDMNALKQMQKICKAMSPVSSLFIQEFSKNMNSGKIHAGMIEMYAGRLRSSKKWKQLATLAEMRTTFEAYPAAVEGFLELTKV